MLRYKSLFVLLIFIVVARPITAQEENTIVANNLNNPRHLFFAEDGTLYIAEAGSAGIETIANPSGSGEVPTGPTARVSRVAPDGVQSVFIDNMPSLELSEGEIIGVHAIYVDVDANEAFIVLGQGRTPGPSPTTQSLAMNGVGILASDGGIAYDYIDLYAYEQANNPDASMEIASNPMDFAFNAEPRLMYIADASANAVLRWDFENYELTTFAAWQPVEDGETPAAVPTSVEVSATGEVYVGFLTGYPFIHETAYIEVYSPDGELLTTYTGLTFVTDILLTADGKLYAVEMASSFSEEEGGFTPDSGRIVEVTADGLVPLAEKLNFPFGMAQDAEGNFYVTINSEFSELDTGAVIRLAQ